MPNQVRVGIVGLGAQGRTYAKLLLDGRVPALQLAALCGANPHSSRTAEHADYASQAGVPFFASYPELLASGTVDAVIITTPHFEHPAQAIAALDAGLHVLLEKPAGVYTKQAAELFARAAERPDLTLAMIFNQRTNQLYRDLKTLTDSGELGALRSSHWQVTHWWRPDAYYTSSPWRASWGGEGGGVLVNQAPHQLDMWQWLCGPATRVFARAGFGSHRDIPVEDEVFALVEFGPGVTGVFSSCTHDLVGTDRLELLYDKGKVVVTASASVTIWRYSDDERTISRELSAADAAKVPSGAFDRSQFWTEQTREYTSVWGEQHAAVMQNFGDHIAEGVPLIAPGSEGMLGVRLANGMHLSAWTGADVDLTSFDDDGFLAELNKRITAEGRYPERH